MCTIVGRHHRQRCISPDFVTEARSKNMLTWCYLEELMTGFGFAPKSLNQSEFKIYSSDWRSENKPFPGYLLPLIQNESSRKTFHMKMSLLYTEINL